MPSQTNGVSPARPTIAIDGQDNTVVGGGLLNLLVIETTEGLYRCEASIGNWGEKNGTTGFLYFDRSLIDFGKRWQVKIGAGSNAQVIFDGRITGLEAQFPEGSSPRYITILAEDRFQDLRMTRRTRTFEQMSDADVMNQIANDHGLTPSVQVSGPTYKVLAQVNQSDLAFLRERARANDAEVWMEGTNLHAQKRSQRNGGTVSLTWQGTLRAFSVLADLAHQRSSLAVNGWDVSSKNNIQHLATDSDLGGELNGGSSGASILAAALGQRKEAIVHTVPLSSSEAQATAEALFRCEARRFVTGRGVTDPDPQLRVGAYVDLQGLGPLFSGKYYVASVRHLFDGVHGFRSEFSVERPGLGQPS